MTFHDSLSDNPAGQETSMSGIAPRAVASSARAFSAAILIIFPCEIAVHPLVFLLFITSFSLPGNVATQLPSFVSRITEVRNLSVPSGLYV